ncbi:response regulator [candidate division FCPU426 bacterium]|nr:response regulator [candidate division FCPU426 bacterium]
MNSLLLVDSDVESLRALARFLQAEGFSVDQASTLEEAKKFIVQNMYAVILAGLQVVDGGGEAIVEAIKKLRPETQVMVITGAATLDSAIACIRAGAVDYIVKPCANQRLCDSIRNAMNKKALSHENVLLRGLNDSKDKFLTLVSHELRTPLTLIYGYLTLFQRQTVGLNAEQVDLLKIVLKSCKQLNDIVSNIQTITQAEAGQTILHLQKVLPRKLLSDVLAEVKATTYQRRLSMILEEGAEIPSVEGDPIRLYQVVSELLYNAIRNTPDGGEIILGARQEDGAVVLWVRDNGIGIPEEEQGKIFEPFYEVADVKQHSSHASRFGGGGIGIGLTLVKRIIEAHNGSVRLESLPGKGTCVEIVLPINKGMLPKDFDNTLTS